ncbi:MAG: hypothetical protein JRE47_14785 [Deltaproteobacteria bacterium]|nr:hypothetical protein [Deltaproteobacteria bacterium]
MNQAADMSATIFDTALTAIRPIKALMDIAEQSINQGALDNNLHNIDAMLTGTAVDYIRKGMPDQIDAFADDMLAFLDSNLGDTLKSSNEGKRFYYRWEHFVDLCSAAVDNYDPRSMARFIASRKHGQGLMQILFENIAGLRSKDLAQLLGISSQQLAKLLREFEDRDLVVREREKKFTLVRLDFLGRAYMSDEESEMEPITVFMEDDMDAEMKQRIGGLTDKTPKDWLMAA